MPNYGAFIMLGAFIGLAISAAIQSYREPRKVLPPIAAERHQHYLDLERSNISIAPDGELYAKCAFFGCTHTVAMNPNLARAWSGTGSVAR